MWSWRPRLFCHMIYTSEFERVKDLRALKLLIRQSLLKECYTMQIHCTKKLLSELKVEPGSVVEENPLFSCMRILSQ